MKDFPYCDIRFADIQLLRYRVPGFEALPLRQKTLVYYLSEAALAGRDILWDQNCRYNLRIRRMLEAVYKHMKAQGTESEELEAFETYLKRVWFSNGIHHHYSMDKFQPGFSRRFLEEKLREMGYPVEEDLMEVVFNPEVLAKRVNQCDGQDLLKTSAMNYYAPDVTQAEAEGYYAGIKKADEAHPVMYGLNSRLEHDENNQLVERVWKSGGMYGKTIDRIIHYLEMAQGFAESEEQRQVIGTLIEFYRTGDLETFDRYTIQWVYDTACCIDFTNGFTEVYGDPLGLKGSWEGYVNLRARMPNGLKTIRQSMSALRKQNVVG